MATDVNNGAEIRALPPITLGRRLDSRKRVVWYTFILGLALFVGGMVAGGGAVVVYFKRQALVESPSPKRIGELLMTGLTREFALSPEESADIRSRIEKQVAVMEASSQAYGESVRSQFGELCGGICGVLGPKRARQWKEAMRREFGENATVYIHMNDCHDHGDDCQCLIPEEPHT